MSRGTKRVASRRVQFRWRARPCTSRSRCASARLPSLPQHRSDSPHFKLHRLISTTHQSYLKSRKKLQPCPRSPTVLALGWSTLEANLWRSTRKRSLSMKSNKPTSELSVSVCSLSLEHCARTTTSAMSLTDVFAPHRRGCAAWRGLRCRTLCRPLRTGIKRKGIISVDGVSAIAYAYTTGNYLVESKCEGWLVGSHSTQCFAFGKVDTDECE